MNMNHNPTREQLSALLATCDDTADHHVLWVAKDGEVHVTPLGDDSPPSFDRRPDVLFRHETCGAGHGYVGSAAAANKKYVHDLYDELVREWVDGRTGYSDWDDAIDD
jgi:hypothetical protein